MSCCHHFPAELVDLNIFQSSSDRWKANAFLAFLQRFSCWGLAFHGDFCLVLGCVTHGLAQEASRHESRRSGKTLRDLEKHPQGPWDWDHANGRQWLGQLCMFVVNPACAYSMSNVFLCTVLYYIILLYPVLSYLLLILCFFFIG